MYIRLLLIISCFQCFKDRKMRANHNEFLVLFDWRVVVSNVSKILKWEQITTLGGKYPSYHSYFQCFKDFSMSGNVIQCMQYWMTLDCYVFVMIHLFFDEFTVTTAICSIETYGYLFIHIIEILLGLCHIWICVLS